VLIKNARIVNEGRQFEGDVLIQAGRIERIGPALSCPAGSVLFDARGRLLIPGMIDDQVHFREPGLTHKGDLATESAAAVAGGITSFFDMPNVSPTTTTRAALAAKYALARGRTHANHAFYLGAANDNADEIARLERDEACAVKVFMGASTGNMLVDDPRTLERIFARSRLPIVTHCEDTPMIKRNEDAARRRWGDRVPFSEHPRIRSAEACYASTKLAVGLAKQFDADLHVLHLTTARELDFFTAGPVESKKITVEACVHHLFFDDSQYATLGAQIKCNPAVKTAADRRALLAAVREGRIDVIATDHAPHTAAEKNAPSYFKAPSGLPLVQHALLALFKLVADGELDVYTVVDKTSHAVAKRFGIVDRGYIREGCHADLTLVDTGATTTVTRQSLLYKVGWSPFEGMSFPARIEATWVNGELAYHDGHVIPRAAGQRIRFA
jgi:dihydroorotase